MRRVGYLMYILQAPMVVEDVAQSKTLSHRIRMVLESRRR